MNRPPDPRPVLRVVTLGIILAAAACKNSNEGLSRSARDAATTREIARAEAAVTSAVAGPGADLSTTRTADPNGPLQVLDFVANDDSITGPDTVLNGPVEIRFTNRGRFPHELRFVLLPVGRAITASISDLRNNPGYAVNFARGGAGPLAPGGSMTVVMPIQDGIYVLLCALPDSAGNPWFKSGLLHILRVTGTSPAVLQPATLPANAAITTSEFSWRFSTALVRGTNRTLPVEGRARTTALARGPAVIMIDHLGGGGHDLIVMRADGPLAMDDYVSWRYLGGRQAPDIIGGFTGLFATKGGLRAYIKLDLTPGSYLIFCPTLKRGTLDGRGFQLGEFDQFIVR